jgi:endonuclease/exonuclease/phosphatase (EEP) superfamily protein YafD
MGHAVARPLIGPRKGWLELADDLLPTVYLVGPALVGTGALLGSKRLALAGAGVCLTYGLHWGDRYLRSHPRTARASSDLTVMTFNTLAWQRSGSDIVASICAANPDIVGLQEIGPRAFQEIVEALGEQYPYTADATSTDSRGAAVLSRYPIRDARSFQITERSHRWQSMTIETPFGEIAYLNIHTKIPLVEAWRAGQVRIPRSFHSKRRRDEIESLVALVQAETRPTIVTGDFNMTERSTDHASVAAHLRDAYRAVGRGLGHTFPRFGKMPRAFPCPWPALRLDYVWHSDHFEAASAEVGNAGHSDHHPVIVGLRWSQAQVASDGRVPLAASAV